MRNCAKLNIIVCTHLLKLVCKFKPTFSVRGLKSFSYDFQNSFAIVQFNKQPAKKEREKNSNSSKNNIFKPYIYILFSVQNPLLSEVFTIYFFNLLFLPFQSSQLIFLISSQTEGGG